MAKYSILFGTTKYHAVGPFRFPVYEDLTPGETRGMEIINKKQAKSTYRSMKLAQRIAKEQKIAIKEAIDALSNLGADENESILYEYAEDIEKLSADSSTVTEQKIELVTLFMQCRGQVKMPDSEEWVNTSDWCDKDTETMPGKLLENVFQLMLWERDGWPSEGNETLREKEKK